MTVTLLFSDVERSTQLLERHGRAMGDALARHHELFEEAINHYGGRVFETVGDAVYAAFDDPPAAVAAAAAVQIALAAEDWARIGRLSVRIALHTGEVEPRGSHFSGPALFRVARLQAIAHGGQTVLSGITAGLVSDALPDTASLRDLGVHRLKDLLEPEHVYQLLHPRLPDAFPALRSLDSRPQNLPLQLSSFVGREAELRDIAELLQSHRLVTLLGPGGIGKTRLALQVAAEDLERRRDGVFFVDLSALRDATLVGPTIAATLGVREQPGESVEDTLAAHLHDHQLLLVLDNLEQLLPDASEILRQLLMRAPELRMLVTSRAPLRIRGEREYSTPGLSSTSHAALESNEPPAVALFVDRARAVRPDLVLDAASRGLIVHICERLDGLPLAIELAAARLRVFTVAALHERLDRRLGVLSGGPRDLPARQQTLSATIAWSEELLTDSQRRLFARLGVFAGGFTFEAVEAVAADAPDADVLAGLDALVEHSLVLRADDGRDQLRGMLESIREFAVERLSEDEADEARTRHLGHFLALTERGADVPSVENELHNFRVALGTAKSHRNGAAMLRIMVGTYAYWLEGAARLQEASDWMERGLRVLDDNIRLRADAMWRFAYFVDGLGDVPRAVSLSEEAAHLAEGVGDDALLARVLRSLGVFYARLGSTDPGASVVASRSDACRSKRRHRCPGTHPGSAG